MINIPEITNKCTQRSEITACIPLRNCLFPCLDISNAHGQALDCTGNSCQQL